MRTKRKQGKHTIKKMLVQAQENSQYYNKKNIDRPREQEVGLNV